MALLFALAEHAYKKSSFYAHKKHRKKQDENRRGEEFGEDYEVVEVIRYEMIKRKPYDIMTINFKKTSLERSMEMAANLSGRLAVVRANNLIFEPIHVRFVGKAGQCKTQYALHVMKMLDDCGLIGVNRTATDGFFDDLVKQVKNMSARRLDDAYVYHQDIEDRENVDLDVLFLDEVNAKKTDDPGMQTIMDGVTPMRWKPLMANPSYKGRTYKPALWLSTANHEITKHEYCIPAVLRRTHHRYVVSGGRLYNQECYKLIDASGAFMGGFSTCHGDFGRWEEHSSSTSKSETIDAENNRTVCLNTSRSNTKVVRIVDTFNLEKFKCEHCKEISFESFLEITLTQVIERISSALKTHEQTSALTKTESSDSGVAETEK
jgi:hypothetical protein